VKKASGPAKASARWRKEVEEARERVHRGFLAALAHAGLFVGVAAIVGLGSPLPGDVWRRVVAIAVVLGILGWLVKRGVALAALLLLVGSVGAFVGILVVRPGLSLYLASIVFAWFYFDALRGALALKRRLHAPAME
jgi:hypothetical protein